MTTTTNERTQDLIDDASAGFETPVPVAIYWDRQDPHNEGPAYRIGDPASGEQESGPLEFVAWSTGEEHHLDIADYFADGRYLGPDQLGVYPAFKAH